MGALGTAMGESLREAIQLKQQGYWDDEVRLPSHDRICTWAAENSLDIASAIYPHQFGRGWRPEDVDVTHAWATQRERDRFKFDSQRICERPRPSPKTRIRWEVALYAEHDKRQLGFADLTIDVMLPRITAEWAPDSRGPNDVYMRSVITWASEVWTPSILVEAKSQMPTMGELMRQLNHYRQGFSGPLVVIAPDDSLSSLLSDQDVRFFRYPG